MKQCSYCHTLKPLEEFTKQSSNKDGFRANCRLCSRKACLSWRSKNSKKMKESNRQFRSLNPLYGNLAHKLWRKQNPSKRKANKIKHYWPHLTSKEAAAEYSKLLITCNNACAVCKTPQASLKRALCVDHCHKTNKVRGLLCSSCNFSLGHAKDDIKVLHSLIAYLKLTGGQNESE